MPAIIFDKAYFLQR